MSVVDSHLEVRSRHGVFDVSHMGQLIIRGSKRAEFLEELVVGDIIGLSPGQARLSLITNDAGGLLDDTIITNKGDHIYMVVNGACKDTDLLHMRAHLKKFNKRTGNEVTIEHVDSSQRSLLALQGPEAHKVMQSLAPAVDVPGVGFMEHVEATIDGHPCWVSRCGYTGEDGFEISVPNEGAVALLERIVAREGVHPAGLAVRDSLRLEAGLCLYGHDIDERRDPISAALAWTINKVRREGARANFKGAQQILGTLKNKSNTQRRVGFVVDKGAPAREGALVFAGDAPADATDSEAIGVVTSGTFSPSLKKALGMCYVDKKWQSGAMTAMSSAPTMSFFVLGDVGGSASPPFTTAQQLTVAAGLERTMQAVRANDTQSDVRGLFLLGDNFYDVGVASVNDPRWQSTFERAYAFVDVPVVAILGNHDVAGNATAQVLYTGRPLPVFIGNSSNSDIGNGSGSIDSGKEADSGVVRTTTEWTMPARFFTRRELLTVPATAAGAGPALVNVTCDFVLIDTEELVFAYLGAASAELQWTWLATQLADSDADWLVVVGHHPARSLGTHGSTPALVQRLVPLMRQHGVAVYLSGHDHSQQVLSGAVTDNAPKLTMIVEGSAAKSTKVCGSSGALFTRYGQGGFGRLIVGCQSLIYEVYDEEGHARCTLRLPVEGRRRPAPDACANLEAEWPTTETNAQCDSTPSATRLLGWCGLASDAAMAFAISAGVAVLCCTILCAWCVWRRRRQRARKRAAEEGKQHGSALGLYMRAGSSAQSLSSASRVASAAVARHYGEADDDTDVVWGDELDDDEAVLVAVECTPLASRHPFDGDELRRAWRGDATFPFGFGSTRRVTHTLQPPASSRSAIGGTPVSGPVPVPVPPPRPLWPGRARVNKMFEDDGGSPFVSTPEVSTVTFVNAPVAAAPPVALVINTMTNAREEDQIVMLTTAGGRVVHRPRDRLARLARIGYSRDDAVSNDLSDSTAYSSADDGESCGDDDSGGDEEKHGHGLR